MFVSVLYQVVLPFAFAFVIVRCNDGHGHRAPYTIRSQKSTAKNAPAKGTRCAVRSKRNTKTFSRIPIYRDGKQVDLVASWIETFQPKETRSQVPKQNAPCPARGRTEHETTHSQRNPKPRGVSERYRTRGASMNAPTAPVHHKENVFDVYPRGVLQLALTFVTRDLRSRVCWVTRSSRDLSKVRSSSTRRIGKSHEPLQRYLFVPNTLASHLRSLKSYPFFGSV